MARARRLSAGHGALVLTAGNGALVLTAGDGALVLTLSDARHFDDGWLVERVVSSLVMIGCSGGMEKWTWGEDLEVIYVSLGALRAPVFPLILG